MKLVSKVRATMKSLINGAKNTTISRDVDVFNEIAFDYTMSSINFGTLDQAGSFAIQYLVSPKPDSNNTAPSITYDEIITSFDNAKARAFREAGLIILSYSYEQSDIVTDPLTGSVSLSFTINIQVTERTR